MKTIKVKYLGFFPGFGPETNPLVRVISRFYNLVESDDPDFIISNVFDELFDYCHYKQPRIMYSGENYIPDFNSIDYAFSPYNICFYDRHIQFPIFLFDYNGHGEKLLQKNRNYSDDFLSSKNYFACFIASHESQYGIRGSFFKKLNSIKRVESIGSYLNNMPNGIEVNHLDGTKERFQRKCKFSLCFESTVHKDFITEKITDAFFTDTIPIYYGSPNVTEYFNEKAFINCSSYDNFDQVIERIIELDSDNDKYLETLRQPIFKDDQLIEDIIKNVEQSIINIFEQSPTEAIKRSVIYSPKRYEDYLIETQKLKKGMSNRSLVYQFSGTELLKALLKRSKERLLRTKVEGKEV